MTTSNALAATVDRLVGLSLAHHDDPYRAFDWPAELPEDQYWMSPELLTVWRTPVAERLTEAQRRALSKWESIHFYSLNIHGIRELLAEVVARIHTPGFEVPSSFFHHFIGEENGHMWFFAEFCLRYGRKIYPDRTLKLERSVAPDIDTFLVFARILVFEELVDYFNVRMANDTALHPLIRQLNAVHHRDESRHIAFGRQIVRSLHRGVREQHPAGRLREIETYVRGYLRRSLEALYSPAAYRDAGIEDPYRTRARVLGDAARAVEHDRFLRRTLDFLAQAEILSDARLEPGD